MAPAIRLTNVTKLFGSHAALNNVSLEVPAGTVFAILGKNGAGKSTAIRTMLGLIEPDGGDAEVLGLSSRTQSLEIRRRVGYLPERPTLYEWMTVEEIGWFTAGFYGGDFLYHYKQLTRGFALPSDRALKNLSKGMRAKVALSLAMAHQPELLILDEPTSGLDTLVRREFLDSMIDLAASGRTVFLSSHQIGEVERVADIVAILRQGKLAVVERLDVLKEQIREITVTLDDATVGTPTVQGELLYQARRGRQWQILLRNPDDVQIERLRQHPSVQTLESRTPGLEEIFVAYMQPAEQAAPQRAEVETATS